MYRFLWLTFAVITSASCNTIRVGNTSELKDGYYKDSENRIVYVSESEDEALYVFSSSEMKDENPLHFESYSDTKAPEYRLRKNTFDLDLITIPVKIRPKTEDVGTQLNANLNVALFMGFRKDFHRIRYRPKPLGRYQRKVSNIGFSLGMISGFSNTLINETTTGFNQNKEYDGLTWMYGIGAIMGMNRVTFGLAIGKDLLLDHNNKYWIYERNMWYGISLGLNLN